MLETFLATWCLRNQQQQRRGKGRAAGKAALMLRLASNCHGCVLDLARKYGLLGLPKVRPGTYNRGLCFVCAGYVATGRTSSCGLRRYLEPWCPMRCLGGEASKLNAKGRPGIKRGTQAAVPVFRLDVRRNLPEQAFWFARRLKRRRFKCSEGTSAMPMRMRPDDSAQILRSHE